SGAVRMRRPGRSRRALLALLASLAVAASGAPGDVRAAAIDWIDAGGAAANPGAELGSASYSIWSIEGDRVTARFLLPLADARRIAGSALQVLVQQRVGQYLLDHLSVRAGQRACEAIDQGYDIGRVDPLTVAPGLSGFEIFFQCAAPGLAPGGTAVDMSNLHIEDHALFDRLAGQVNFARVQGAGAASGSAFHTELFTPSHQVMSLATVTTSPEWGRYLALGFTHLLGHWDHLCLLLAVVLLAAGQRERWLLGALAFGYACSLLLTAGFGLVPRPGLLGSALGALIALASGQLVARQLAATGVAALVATGVLGGLAALALLTHASWSVLLLAGLALLAGALLGAPRSLAPGRMTTALLLVLFGILDGCVLPEALTPQEPSLATLLPMTLGYDVGAFIAGAGVMSLLRLAGRVLSRRSFAARMQSSYLAMEAATAVLGALGVLWMLSRLHA
ncbi:MAG TPA: hypothetical protein VKT19_05100, partial [Steroidobacteraceae bacterium]|nr:hypothetical protein [Steroidobacteraceae bacterium]